MRPIRKYISIAILGTILVLIYIAFGRRPAFSPSKGNDLVSNPSPTGAGIPQISAPAGATVTLGVKNGSVTMDNFYKKAVGAFEDEIIIAKNSAYQIDYAPSDSSFAITIIKGPLADTRAAAEADFLSALGISREDACRLNASVVVSAAADPSAGGRIYPLSFCSPQ